MTAHEPTPSDAAIAQAYLEREDTARKQGSLTHTGFCDLVNRRAREIEQGRGALPELPPLPEPVSHVESFDEEYGHREREASQDYFTAEQMRAMYQKGIDDCRRMGNRDE